MGLGVEVASLFATLGIDDTQFNSKLGTADTKMRTFGNSMSTVKDRWKDFGRAAQVAAIPIGLALGKGIADASAFDSALSEISARTGVVGDDLKEVSDLALKMGADTKFSAQDAANGMLELLASGDSLEQAMARIGDVMTLATVGSIDLKSAADGVTDVMAAMRLEVGDTGFVVDVLSAAASSSSATVSDMIQAMASGGNTAANFGIDVAHTAGIMAILAENSIKGSEAGTALRSMLLNMTRPTEAVEGAWKELGTSFFDTSGEARDFTLVMEDIKAALSTKTMEDQNRILKDLAGNYGFTAISALLAGDGMREMQHKLGTATSATEIAEAKMNTFEGSLISLKGSLETLNIKAFTPFMNNVLKPIVQDFTKVINKVGEFAEANPELTTTVISVGAAFVTATAGISAFGVVANLVTTGVTALVATALSPLGAALVVGGGLVLAYMNNWGGFRDFIDGPVTDTLTGLTRGLWAISAAGDNVATILDGLAAGDWTIGEVFTASWKALVNEVALKPAPRDFQKTNTRTIVNPSFKSPEHEARFIAQGGATLVNQSNNQGNMVINVNTNGTNGRQIGQDIHRELKRGGIR